MLEKLFIQRREKAVSSLLRKREIVFISREGDKQRNS